VAPPGHAVADVLFGDANPSAKLPVSFPRHVGQLPLYYNHKSTGRPGPQSQVFWSHYTDAPKNTPLYPFGFGLSYTTFSYSELRLDRAEIGRDDSLHVSVTVTNSGSRAGAEVVQLYVRDLVGSLTRPVKELKGFRADRATARAVTGGHLHPEGRRPGVLQRAGALGGRAGDLPGVRENKLARREGGRLQPALRATGTGAECAA
jgi:Glycosyl hydrolase family 3 C-terminal domain/Fibronectin type III-like domain